MIPGVQGTFTALDPTVNRDVHAVLEKASEPLYRCLTRLAVTTPRCKTARGRMHALAGAFSASEGRDGRLNALAPQPIRFLHPTVFSPTTTVIACLLSSEARIVPSRHDRHGTRHLSAVTWGHRRGPNVGAESHTKRCGFP